MIRGRGCVLGAFVGDAAGAYLEFAGISNINERSVEKALSLVGGGRIQVGPGQITDDSEMAMCLLHAAYDDTQHLNLDLIQKNFGLWLKSPPFDIGYTT
jgi:ADP-ribosyl-[dinitrogen reductase] hydrolase